MGSKLVLIFSLTNQPRNIRNVQTSIYKIAYLTMQRQSEPKHQRVQLLKQTLEKMSKPSRIKSEKEKTKPSLPVSIELVSNDGNRPSLKILTSLKNIISRQLPKMPREYITKIIFDKRHQSIVAISNSEVIGGACFRCFAEQPFSELVFLAIQQNFREQGLGSQLLNGLKELLQKRKVDSIVTFADISAVGFFRKQAFEKTVDTKDKRWNGFIKVYEGGTLMECKIEKRLKYSQFRDILKSQQKSIKKQIQIFFSFNETEYSISTLEEIAFKKEQLNGIDDRSTQNDAPPDRAYCSILGVEDIPGVLENNWCREREEVLQEGGVKMTFMLTQLEAVECIRKHPLCKLVREMQSNHQLRLPIDISTIEKKIIRGINFSNEDLISDLRSIPSFLKERHSEEIEGIEEMEKKVEVIVKSLQEKSLMLPIKLERQGKVRMKL